MRPIFNIELGDVQTFKILIEILNGASAEAPAHYIKNIDVYESKLKKEHNTPEPKKADIKATAKKKIKTKTKTKVKKKCAKADWDLETGKPQQTEEAEEAEAEEPEETEISRETNKGQIKIITTDPHQTLISYIELNAIDFKKFEMLPDDYTIGWNIDEFFRWIKGVDKNGTMTMRMDQDDLQNMMLSVDSGPIENTCSLKVLNPQEKTKRQIEIKFTMAIRMPSSVFHKVCKELSQFSTHAEIICTPECLKIICKGEMSAHSQIFKADGSENAPVIKCINNENGKPDIVRLIFELKHINLMYKCQNLSKDVEIYLKPGCVMFLRYPFGLNSRMTVGIAPASIKEKSLGNANYDDENDKYYDDDDIVLLQKDTANLSINDDE